MSEKPTYEELEQRIKALEKSESERKQADELLKESETLFSTIFASNPAAIAITRIDDGRFVNVNNAWQDITGYSSVEVIGRTSFDLNLWVNTEQRDRLVEMVRDQGKASSEIHFRNKSGEIRYLLLSAENVEVKGQNYLLTMAQDITELKRVEDVQQETLERLNFSMETANEGFWEWDLSTDKITFDRLGLKMLGYNPDYESIDSQTWLDKIHPIHKNNVLSAFDDYLSGKSPVYNVEFPIQKNDGSYIWISSIARVFKFDSKGKPLLVVGIHQEISDRKKAEQALLESNQRFDLAMKASQDGIFDWNLITNDIYYSPRWKSMLGYDYDEIPNDFSIWETNTAPEDVKKSWTMQQEVINKKRDRFDMEFKMRHKDGHWVDILSRAEAVFDENGKAVRMIGTHIDITERKQAEKAILESEEKHRIILETAISGFWITSKHGELLDVNDAYCHMSGYSNDELLTMKISDVETIDSPTAIKNRISNITKNGSDRFETKHRRKDGSVYDVEINIQYQPFHGGQFVCFINDITDRKQTERVIQESETKYKNLVETASDAIYMMSENGTILDTNQTACDMLGRSKDEIVGSMIDSVDPSFPIDELSKFWEGVPFNEQYIFETTHLRKDGSLIPIEISGKKYKLNEELFYYGIARDITDRKKTEEKLKDSEEKYRSLVEGSLQGMVVALNDPLRIAYASSPMETISGYSPEEIESFGPQELTELIHKDDRESFFKGFADRIAGKYVEPKKTYRLNRKDGRICWIEFYSTLIQYNNEPATQTAFVDITERKKAEEELFESKRRLEQAQEAGKIGSWEYYIGQNTIWGSNESKKIYGFDLQTDSFTLDEIEKCIQDNEYVHNALKELIVNNKPYNIEFEIILKNSKQKKIINSIAEQQTGINGKLEKVVGIIVDITERKQAEKEHEKLQNQLQQAQKMESVGLLAGGIAHDFNNMLQIIMGHAQVLEQNCSEERNALSAKGVLDSARRAADLTKQLLLFSRRQVMSLQTLDFNELVENTLSMIRRIIGEQIELQWLPGASVGLVHADRSMLEQVVMNLCVNARDAMPSGGLLKIETTNELVDSELCATHSWVSPGRFVLLSVTDTGEGMDKATMERIFEPFYTTKKQGKGTGIGLATVYGIVKQHKGMILAHTEPGNGSLFQIYLPLSEMEAVEAVEAETTPDGYASGGSETILLAEDDDMVRDLAKEMLERVGYSVLVARDGHEAISVFRSSDSIDLLLFDVIMPGLGGHGAMEEIRKLQPDIPVLFSSGYSKDAIHTDFVLHEGVMLIQKPYSSDQLLLAVRRALDS